MSNDAASHMIDMSLLPEGWRLKPLKQVTRPSKVKVDPRQCPDRPYLSLEHIESETTKILGRGTASDVRSTKAVFKAGDVLYGRLRPYLNKVARPDFDGVASTDILVFPPQQELDQRYLLRFLNSATVVDHAHHHSMGLQMPRIGFEVLGDIPIPLPPIHVQKQIAEILENLIDQVDSAKDRLATIPALLKKFRQSVLAAACSGQLTADWRESQSRLTEIDSFIQDIERAGLLSRAKTPKNAQSEPTPVFDVPDSWRWVSLRTLVELKGGVTKGEKRRAGQELISVPYLRVANVQRGFLDLSDIKHIEATPKELEELRLQPNDILFNEGGDRDKLGRGWVWEGQIDNCIHQNHVFRGRLFDDRIPAKLVSLYGNSIGAQHFIDEGKQTVNLASLSITKLGDMAFPLAPPEEMEEIMRQVESLFALADSIESRLTEATAQVGRTTQVILAKAFRGEL